MHIRRILAYNDIYRHLSDVFRVLGYIFAGYSLRSLIRLHLWCIMDGNQVQFV